MYRYIKASFDNAIPDWLRQDKWALKALNKAGIDLKNAEFSNSRQGKAKENYTVYLVKGTKDRSRHEPFVWIPGIYNDDRYVGIKDWNRRGYDPTTGKYQYGNVVDKAVKYVAKKDLDIGDVIYININDNKKAPRESYKDPRYAYTTSGPQYAGQYFQKAHTNWKGEEIPDTWETRSGRDKSGYEIPNPKQRLRDFYNTEEGTNRRADKAKKQFDGIYAQLKTLKTRLSGMTPKGDDLGDYTAFRSLGRAYDYFSDAVEAYNNALETIESYEKSGYSMWGSYNVDQALHSLSRAQSRIDDVNRIILK